MEEYQWPWETEETAETSNCLKIQMKLSRINSLLQKSTFKVVQMPNWGKRRPRPCLLNTKLQTHPKTLIWETRLLKTKRLKVLRLKTTNIMIQIVIWRPLLSFKSKAAPPNKSNNKSSNKTIFKTWWPRSKKKTSEWSYSQINTTMFSIWKHPKNAHWHQNTTIREDGINLHRREIISINMTHWWCRHCRRSLSRLGRIWCKIKCREGKKRSIC